LRHIELAAIGRHQTEQARELENRLATLERVNEQQTRRARELESRLASLEQEKTAQERGLADKLAKLKRMNEELMAQVDTLESDNDRLRAKVADYETPRPPTDVPTRPTGKCRQFFSANSAKD
jgi:TolA-binding protein